MESRTMLERREAYCEHKVSSYVEEAAQRQTELEEARLEYNVWSDAQGRERTDEEAELCAGQAEHWRGLVETGEELLAEAVAKHAIWSEALQLTRNTMERSG